MILKICTAGDPVLRQAARPLTRDEILEAHVQELIAHMRETVRDAPGVGLAAPQIGLGLQLAVIEDRPEYVASLSARQIDERGRRPVPFHIIINPVLYREAETEVDFFEGCLSLPGFSALVPRATQVRVECLDQHGMPQVIRASGWYARILQHEIDHLNGTLYLDRMHTRTFTSLDNLARHWKERSAEEIHAALEP
jgi:peptide deformylase